MRAVVTIQHPAHVHFFRHAVAELQERGHEVAVFAREKDVVVDVLEEYGVDHEVLAGPATSLAGLAAVQCTYEARLLRRVRRLDPDVITAVGGIAAAHVGAVLDVPSVLFYDTEHARLVSRLAFPFADVVCTPDCFGLDLGPKHRRYPAYHELAYLHPRRFVPDPSTLDGLRVDPEDPYVVVRLSSWGAAHDVGHGGFEDAREVVRRLERTGAAVLLSAEGPIPASLEPYRVTATPGTVHDLLYFADAFVGEGATMAAESAVLGTPAVYVNTLSLGYLDELESRYGLLFGFDGPGRQADALATAAELLESPGPVTWHHRRARLLEDKIDATDVILREVDAATRRARAPA